MRWKRWVSGLGCVLLGIILVQVWSFISRPHYWPGFSSKPNPEKASPEGADVGLGSTLDKLKGYAALAFSNTQNANDQGSGALASGGNSALSNGQSGGTKKGYASPTVGLGPKPEINIKVWTSETSRELAIVGPKLRAMAHSNLRD